MHPELSRPPASRPCKPRLLHAFAGNTDLTLTILRTLRSSPCSTSGSFVAKEESCRDLEYLDDTHGDGEIFT